MKAYGLPRNPDVEHPAVADVCLYGRASHVGQVPGNEHSIIRSSAFKRRARRIWKRAARRANAALCRED